MIPFPPFNGALHLLQFNTWLAFLVMAAFDVKISFALDLILASRVGVRSRGVQAYFPGSYGRVLGQPQSYQDDILRVASDVFSARAGTRKLTAMMLERQLTCHPTKTCYLVYGSQNHQEQIRKELDQEPLTFGDFQVQS